MELAKKLLGENRPLEALERLKMILGTDSEAWRVHELIGAAFHDLCDAEGAAQANLRAAMADKYLRSQRMHFSNYIFALHYLPQVDISTLKSELAIYNSLYRDVKRLEWRKTAEKRISVGYIAPNFNESSSARFYEALLTDYDRAKYKVTAWSLSSEEDFFTMKIKRSVEGYFDVSEVSFEEVAEKIRDFGVEILIDLGGHTEGGATLQIMGYKPARVQLCGIGYFDSTGLEAVDYFIGDEFLIKRAEIFTEGVLKLKKAFALKPSEKFRRVGRKTGKNFVFGSLNNFMKLSEGYLMAVKRILEAVDGSKMIFRDTTGLRSRQKALEERLNAFGIRNFEVRRGEDDFLTDYGEIDMILDTFPYPGGFMTALGLYMGVPVLNLCGEMPHSRTGADILRISGVEEMIVYDEATYISKAIELAENRSELAALTEKISIDKLTDTKSFVEDFYERLEAI